MVYSDREGHPENVLCIFQMKKVKCFTIVNWVSTREVVIKSCSAYFRIKKKKKCQQPRLHVSEENEDETPMSEKSIKKAEDGALPPA